MHVRCPPRPWPGLLLSATLSPIPHHTTQLLSNRIKYNLMASLELPPTSSSPTKSPIDSLPDELIAAIQITTITCHPEKYAEPVKQLRCLTNVQLVSRRWRAVALATPALWTILYMTDTRSPSLLSNLPRSGVRPLELYLEPSLTSTTSDIRLIQDFMRPLLQKHAPRIHTLNINRGPFVNLINPFVDVPSGFTNLVELRASGTRIENGERQTLEIEAPRLLLLWMDQCCLDWTRMPMCPSLEELYITEDIEGSTVKITALISTLHMYPHLRVLQLESQFLAGWDDLKLLESLQPVLLERLERLSLRRFYMRELRLIFSLTETPRLESFVMKGMFLSRSQAELERRETINQPLRLQMPALGTLALETSTWSLEIVMELPHIKHLSLGFDLGEDDPAEQVDESFHDICAYWRSLPHPLPLESLQTHGVQLPSILTFLKDSRDSLLPSLRKVTIHYSDVFRTESAEAFINRRDELGELSRIVEVDIFGIDAKALSDRTNVQSWEDEVSWRGSWEL